MNYKKCLLNIIIFILSFFITLGNVNAKTVVGLYNIEYIDKIESGTWLMPGYFGNIKFNGDNSLKSSSAFCLDESQDRPTNLDTSNSYIGFLDYENNSYDAGLYGIYKIFYEWVKEAGGNDINYYRSYFEAAARTWGQKQGVERKGGAHGDFSVCKNAVINGRTSSSNSQCVRLNNIGMFYREAVNMSPDKAKNFVSTLIPDVEINTTSDDTTITYEFTFTNLDKFSSSYPGITIDTKGTKIGAPKLIFDKFQINGVDVTTTNSTILDYTGGGQITSSSQKVILKLNKAGVNFSSDSITIKYHWNHPLNPNNIIYISPNNAALQRMLVITENIEEETVTIHLNEGTVIVPTVPEFKYCKIDNVNNVYYGLNGDVINDYNEFYNQCGCIGSLDKDKNLYESNCNSNITETFNSTFGNCTLENADSNKLNRKTVTKLNPYCTITCNENIKLDNLINSGISVKSGTSFNSTSPVLKLSKVCTNSINKGQWDIQYHNLLDNLINAYNEYLYGTAINANINGEDVCCGEYINNVCTSEGKKYSFTYKMYIRNGNIIDSTIKNFDKSCDGVLQSYDLSYFNGEYNTLTNALETHNNNLNKCYSILGDYSTDSDFYKSEYELRFFYQQRYSNNSIGYRWNDNKPIGMDDSWFESNIISEEKDFSESNYKCNDSLQVYSGLNNDAPQTSNIYVCNGKYELNRDYSYEIQFTPKPKYVNVFYGKTENNVSTNYNNIDYKYDTDMSSIAGSYPNFYTLTKIGEGNKIYNQFKDDLTINYSSGYNYSNSLSRRCEYEISNELTECKDTNCKLNIYYKIVDDKDIDPNNRLETGNGFKNWNNEKGKVVMKKIETDDTYNPDNLQYSFTLDATTLKKIREYNKGKNYSDFIGYECVDENECKSEFIESAFNGTGIFDTSFSSNIDGRNKWNVFTKDALGKYYIDGEEVKLNN